MANKFGESSTHRTIEKEVTCVVTLLKPWPASKQFGRDGGYEDFPAGHVFVDVPQPLGDTVEIPLYGRLDIKDVKIERWERQREVVTTILYKKL